MTPVRPLDPRLLRHAQATRTFLVASVALGATSALLVVAQAFLLARAVVAVFHHGTPVSELSATLGWLVAIAAARAVLAWAAEAVGHRSAAAAISQLRLNVVAAALRTGTELPVGELATLVTRGAAALDGYFARYLPQLVLAVLVPLIAGTAILTQDVLAAVILALTIPLIPVFMVLIGRYTQARVDRQWSTLGLLSGHFLDVVAGLPTLKIFNRARAQAQTLRDIGERYRSATMSVLRISFLSSLVLELLASLSVAIIAVAIGLRLVEGTMTLTAGLTVLILAPEVYLPVRQVGLHFHAASDGVAAAQRMMDLLDGDEPTAPRTRAPSMHGTTIRVRELGVRFADRTALEPVSLQIEPGRITAIVGPSGCGKSTLFAVLLGEVRAAGADLTGTVELVAADGSVTDLAAVEPSSWLSQVGWVPQRPTLLPGTVADNVRFGRHDVLDPEVAAALAAAGLDPATLPDGLFTAISEVGGVSMGQARRIGLARALLRRPALLLLDEPSAALDTATESEVVGTLRRLRDQGSTVVVVTHRAAVIEAADDVLALTGVPA